MESPILYQMLFYGAISSTFAVPSPQKPQENRRKTNKTTCASSFAKFSKFEGFFGKKINPLPACTWSKIAIVEPLRP